MTLLDRYLIQRLATISVFAILLFTVAWLAPETMFKAIQGVAKGKLTMGQGLAYLFYQIPEILTYCLPISMLFGSVFLFRQLSLTGELTAMLASGISFRRLLIPIGVVGLAMSVLFFLTQEILIPRSAASWRELNQKTQFIASALVNPQVTFVEKSSTGVMKKFLVISPKAQEAQNQFIFLFYEGQGDNTRISRMMTATRGTWNNHSDVWQLENGVEYLLTPEGIYQHVAPFAQKIVRTSPVAHGLLAFPSGNPSEFNIKQLERYVRLLTKGQQTEDARFYKVRLFQRFALPFAPLLLALLGTGIGVERSRSRRNLGLTYAALLLLLYNILVPVSTTLGSIGFVPTLVAALLPLALTALGGAAILKLRQSEG